MTFFFFNDTATTEIYTLSLHDALPISLMQLSETYRTVLVLRHYENLKFREIGDVLEVPEGTVKSRMAEALTQMNRILKPMRSEEHTSELQSRLHLVCRLLLEKKKKDEF